MSDKVVGEQILINLYDCKQVDMLDDIESIKTIIHDLIKRLDTYLLKEDYHQFQPYGITGFAIISASHIAVHTWPENHFISIDIFTCKKVDVNLIENYLVNKLQSENYITKNFER